MRVRLDLVHARMGLPTLLMTEMETDWDAILVVEEQKLHEEYGLDSYAASSQPEHDGTRDEQAVPLRYARAATGDIMRTSCFRILRDGSDAPMDEVDRPLADLMTAANAEAFRKWSQLFRKKFDVPTTKRRAKPADIRVWLLTRMAALRHYFAFLPYPEHEAKSWTLAELEVWGAEEVWSEQIGALQRLISDPKTPDEMRSYCTEWLVPCMDTTQNRETAQALARSPQRWRRLAQWVPQGYCRAQPDQLTDSEWRILHVLPYTVGEWPQTPMGRAPRGARATWYERFPFVRSMCHGVVQYGDWSAATLAPSGSVWGEDTAASVATPAAAPRN
ncbi:unnamed protein product [Phytophthora fragariaefolia]|uniref:Unnamed protein product n=1 Tax=Phytophthora fragariaefolia TaxID=1490495 RepID=A0A9W6Y212_9STRA|nr:unnamed protein product [Phytophthora fragariaefolia]